MKITLATGNPGKIREIKAIFEGENVLCTFLPRPNIGDVPETGMTFEENAFIKASAIQAISGGFALADDSGLEVDALKGAPGVLSARFAGVGANDKKNNQHLMKCLNKLGAGRFSARFVAVVCLVGPNGEKHTARGICEGDILSAPQGNHGFGYDPYFRPKQFERTMAQLTDAEKNTISHRGRALRKLIQEIKNQTQY